MDISTDARGAGWDALMQTQADGRELAQGYASALEAAAPRIAADEAQHMADYFDKWADDPQWNFDERNMLMTVASSLRGRAIKLRG